VTDTSVVFNVIGKESGVSSTLGRVKSLFKSTGAEGAASMKVIDHEVEKLDHDIKSAKDSLAVLAREFAKAGTAAERTSLSRQMSRESGNLNKLVKVKNLLPDAGETNEGGRSFGRTLSTAIGSGISSLGSASPIAIGVGAAAVAASPFIGATIAGAVVGAAGLGGIIGGVKLAAKDERVQAAWKAFAASAGTQLENAAAPFVPAVQRAIATASREFDTLIPTIRHVFANTAGYLDPLAKGVAGLVDGVVRGLARAAESAGPVIAVISNALPELGQRIGDLFAMSAEHADAGAAALQSLFTVVEHGIGYVTTVVDLLATMFEWTDRLGGTGILRWIGVLKDAPPAAEGAATGAYNFKKAVDETAKASDTAAGKIDALKKEMDDFADSNLSVYDALTHARGAIVEATKAIEANGRGISANSAQGRKNRDTLSGLARSYNSVTSANDKAGTSADKSMAAYVRQRAEFVKTARQAGYTASAAENLADKVLKVPKTRVTTFSAQTAAARSGISKVQAALNNIPRVVRIAMRITGTQNVSEAAAAVRKNEGRARGGPVNRDQPYMVGEEGPEIVVPQTNGTVLTASMTRGILGKQGNQKVQTAAGIARRTLAAANHPAGPAVQVVGNDRRLVELVRYLVRGTGLVTNAAG
jgi:hypothetical protein